jgi:hypothetical protein
VALVAGLEGAMLVTRPFGDMARFDTVARLLLDGLTGTLVPAGD